MKGFRVALCVLLTTCSLFSEQAKDGFLPLPEGLVALDSTEGRMLFADSQSGPFFRLAQFYRIQPNLATCGVSSCTMALNALKIARPESETHGEFRLFTPENLFTPEVSAVVTKEKVYRSGMSLSELGKLLGTFPLDVTTVGVADIQVSRFREDLKRSTNHSEVVMLVNYLRKGIDQESGGHISPIGAYSEKEDMVLILDVSTYKYPWVWVKTDRLFGAMGKIGNVSRGYVILKAKE